MWPSQVAQWPVPLTPPAAVGDQHVGSGWELVAGGAVALERVRRDDHVVLQRYVAERGRCEYVERGQASHSACRERRGDIALLVTTERHGCAGLLPATRYAPNEICKCLTTSMDTKLVASYYCNHSGKSSVLCRLAIY